jgi:predicted acyltransferase
MLQLQMKHAGWEGFHFIDLIFPLFLMLVGVILPFSILRRVEQGMPRRQLYWHIARRTAVLVVLGWINYGLLRFDWAEMRWSTVLGRIGICYFAAALLLIHGNWKVEVSLVGLILFGYWAAVTYVSVPGFGAGVMTPEGCLTTYLDQQIIPGKLGLGLYDRQGVLSTFTSLATTLIGVLAGRWLRCQYSGNRKTIGLLVAGLVTLAAGWEWGKTFFISRNVWTSSFVLYAAGWSLLLLALFYWLIDVRGFKRWSFFLVVIGMNAITIWVGQRAIDFDYTAQYLVAGATQNLEAIQPVVLKSSAFLLKWLFLWFLFRHKVFFKA